MIEKTALRKTVVDALEEHGVEDSGLAEDLTDAIAREHADDVYEEDEEEEG